MNSVNYEYKNLAVPMHGLSKEGREITSQHVLWQRVGMSAPTESCDPILKAGGALGPFARVALKS